MSEQPATAWPWWRTAVSITAIGAFALLDWSTFAASFPALLVATLFIVGTIRWAQGEIARLVARIELLEEQSDATLAILASDLPEG